MSNSIYSYIADKRYVFQCFSGTVTTFLRNKWVSYKLRLTSCVDRGLNTFLHWYYSSRQTKLRDCYEFIIMSQVTTSLYILVLKIYINFQSKNKILTNMFFKFYIKSKLLYFVLTMTRSSALACPWHQALATSLRVIWCESRTVSSFDKLIMTVSHTHTHTNTNNIIIILI